MMLALGGADGAMPRLFDLPNGQTTRWYTPENPEGLPGKGGLTNRGGKGRAFDSLPAGGALTVLDVKGPGVIDRFWFTLRERDPAMLRSLRFEIFWDGERKPAVSVPFGDFFGMPFGKLTAFENALFSSPEARSFSCVIPMPFRKGARVVLSNDAEREESMVFYEADVTHLKTPVEGAGYLHAFWNRTPRVPLGEPYEILPRVKGKGRFLGDHVAVIGDQRYAGSGWCEGQVRMFLDGDGEHATLVGTGTEDYMGTGWGSGVYFGRYQGSPVADDEGSRWAFYRYHVPDPVFFENALRVTIDDLGGDERDSVRRMASKGAALRPVTVAAATGFRRLLEEPNPPKLESTAFPDGWVNFYRSDDFCSTAFFYLDHPSSSLPPLPSVPLRTAGVVPPKEPQR